MQKVKELEILHSIGKLITSLLDLNELLTRIVEASANITGAEEGYLLLVDEGTGELYLRAGQNLGEEHAQGFRLKVHDSIAGSVIKTGKSVMVTAKEERGLKIKTDYIVKSLLNAPLKVREKVVGVLGVDNKVSDKAFSEDNLRMLSILADYAAIAIENAQLVDDAKQRARNLETLQNLALTISSSLDLDETLRKACQTAVEFFNADHSGLVLFDPSYAEGKVRAEYPALGTLGTTIPLRGVPAEERLIETKEPLPISDIAGDESLGPVRDILGKFDICSILIAPVVFKGRVLGSFSLDATGRLRTFTQNEVDLCKIFATQVAVAIENARLYRSMERQAKRLKVLYEIGREITSALELDRILDSITEHIVRLIGAKKSLFLLVDKKRGCLIKATGYGYPPEHLQRLTLEEVETGVSGWVLRTGKPALVADAQSDPRNTGMALERAKQFDTVPLIVAPLLVKGEVTGTLTAVNTADDPPFTEDDLDMVVMLANQAAIAIEKARLFSQLSETKERLNGLIASSLDAVIAIDQDKKITVFNRQAEKMLGWTAKEMEGRSVARLYVDFGKAQEIHEVVNREGTIVGWEIVLKHKDGTRIPALLSATLVRDSRGNPIGQAGFIRDRRQVNLLEERLRALMQVSQAITGILDLDTVLDLIVASTVAAFPTAQSGAIHLYDKRADTLRVRAITLGYSAEALEALNLRVGEGIAGWVFQNQQPLVVNDTRQDPRYKRIDHPDVQVHRSMICVPLRVRKRVIGTLSLNNSDITGAFQPEDLGLLASFADQAAIAIDNARRMQELEQMRQAAEAMAGALGPSQVLQQIVESAREVLQADSLAIWPYDNVRNQFIPEELVAYGIPRDEVERFRKKEPKKGGTADTVMDQGWVRVADISDPQYQFMGPSTLELLNSIGAKSFQGVALKVGNEKLGVLYVNYNRPQSFTGEDRRTLEIFAYHAALALKKARLLKQLDIAREAAALIAEMTVVEDLGKTLHFIVREAAAVLGADAVTLYPYNPETGQFGHPPAMVDVWNEEPIRRLSEVRKGTATWKILDLDKLHVAEDAPTDEVMRGRFVREEQIKSCAGIPLKAKGMTVGVMFINYRSRHNFTNDEVTNVRLFANQAAVAIRNAQLYQAEQRHGQALKAIQATSAAVSAVLNLDELLPMITDKAADIFEAPATSLMLWDERQENLVIKAAFGLGDEYRQSQQIARSIVDKLIAERGLGSHVFDIHHEPMGDLKLVESEALCNVLVAPLTIGDALIGILNVYSKQESRQFSEREKELAAILANHTAIAIENARLYERQQRRAEQLALINNIAAQISSSLDLEKILQTSVNELARVIGVEQCAIAIFGERSEYGDVVAEYLEEGCVPSKGIFRIPLRDNPTIEIVRKTKRPLAVKDAQHDPIMEKVWDIMKQRRTQSIMIVPIVIGDEVIGTIGLDVVSGPREFTWEEIWLAETIAHHAAIAIQSARQYEELKRTKGLVGARTALAWMGMVSSEWRHRIRNQAQTIQEQIKHLRKDLQQAPKQDHHITIGDRLSMIERLTVQIQERPIVPPLSAEEGVALFALNDLIGERAKQLWKNDPYRRAELRLNLRLSNAATVRASPEWLRRAFDILVDNAIDAVAGREVREIVIGTRVVEGGVEISVSDTGPGIPDQIRERIGLEGIEKSEDAMRLGMGLLMAQTIVHTYGGGLRADVTGPRGTTMVIWLPLAEAEV